MSEGHSEQHDETLKRNRTGQEDEKMASSDAERSCRGAQNNGTSPHVFPGEASAIAEGEVLIESEFLELNSQLHYSKTVHILLTEEFVFVKEIRDRRDSEVYSLLQHDSGKIVFKFLRSEVAIEVCHDCAFTFKAKWSKDSSVWKTYELCGREEVWPKWLRSFNVHEAQGLTMSSSNSIGSDSDSDDCSDDEEGDDLQMIPEYALTLSVDRTISTWSVSMLNPRRVRRLAITQFHQPTLPSLESSRNDSDLEDMFDSLNAGSIYRSNSNPNISLAKPFRCPSLPNVCDLGNVRLDADLRFNSCRTRGQSIEDHLTRDGENSDQNTALATLQQRVENLRAHPSNLNFVRNSKGDDSVWVQMTPPKHHRKHSLCLAIGSEANRIPMPSDFSTKCIPRSRVSFKQESIKENGGVLRSPLAKTKESRLSPKRCLARRSDSLPSSKRPDLSCDARSNSVSENKSVAARRLEFKDDMAFALTEGNELPRKEKVKRFWSVLYKKRPKLKMQITESNDSCKDNDMAVRTDNGNSLSVQGFDLHNGVVAVGRRGGFSDSFAAVRSLASTKEEEATVTVQSKQDTLSADQTPLGKSHISHFGSMRKKGLVKKILSPIFKTSTQQGEISNQVSSPVGEVPQYSDSSDGYLPGLSQRLVDIDASLFAREITLIDKELFIRIPWPELSKCGWMTKDKYVSSPNVMAMVEFFNRVALLAASEVLSQDTASGRARAISKVIQIADKCHLLGNFNSLKALLAGLQCTPVYRLKESWKEVPSKRKKKFRDLSILMGESDNFMLYRTELSNCLENGPCLPFLGNFLTEIAQTHTYLACTRKKLLKNGKASPLLRRNNDKIDSTDGGAINGKITRSNGISVVNGGIHLNGDSTLRDARDRENLTQECNGKRNAKVKRTPSRSKLFRLHSRPNGTASDVSLNRRGNNCAEVLDVSDGNLRKRLNSSTDSVITSSSSLNENSTPRSNSRTSCRPPLFRRLSETSPNQNGSSFSLKTPKRRLSETKSSETRRSFLKGFIRRTPSSQSVKEGRVSRDPSSEQLTMSLSTLSMSESSNHVKSFVDRLAKSQSSPSVKEDVIRGRLSPELKPSSKIEVNRLSSHNLLAEDAPRGSVSELLSGTERQLWGYQIASIQYNFVSRPFVRHFLLNAPFNSEEENYRLSLKRETPSKKANT